jgi:hypothetical protein
MGSGKILRYDIDKHGIENFYKKTLQVFDTAEEMSSWMEKSHTTETTERYDRDEHNGENNSQYGTIWITNEVESKKIKKDEKTPDGWRRGRKRKV